MPRQPVTSIRIPKYIKDEVLKRTNNLSKWVIQAIVEKLNSKKKS